MVPVDITSQFNIDSTDSVRLISAGSYHTMVLTKDSHLYSFGSNQYGQLGDYTNGSRNFPKLLPFKLLVYLAQKDVYNYQEALVLFETQKDGYRFNGWHIDKAKFKGFHLTEMPDYDVILYGKWSPISYSITYYYADYVPSNYYGYNIISKDIILYDAVKEGYIFAGWYDNDLFTGKPIKIIEAGSFGDLEFYAKWYDGEEYIESKMVSVGEIGKTYTVPIEEDDSSTAEVNGGYLIANSETNYELWYLVLNWGLKNGYNFQNLGTEGYGQIEGNPPLNMNLPVVNINWRDTIVWLNALSEMNSLNPVYRNSSNEIIRDSRDENASEVINAIQTNNNGYRLPSSNEWEMAARWTYYTDESYNSIFVGNRYWTPGTFSSGAIDSTLESQLLVAWFSDSLPSGSLYIPQEIAKREANQLGLYDMNGNVGEWVFDIGQRSNTRIVRGGYITSYRHNIYVSSKVNGTLSLASRTYGFRIAKTGE